LSRKIIIQNLHVGVQHVKFSTVWFRFELGKEKHLTKNPTHVDDDPKSRLKRLNGNMPRWGNLAVPPILRLKLSTGKNK